MKQLSINQPFVVKESRGINIFLGLACTGLFVSSFFNNDPLNKDGYNFSLFHLALIPAFLFIRRAFKNKVIMVIDRKGIYYFGELITTWENFVEARVGQKDKVFSIQDNFELYIRYKQPGNKLFRSTIPLGNTQNKAEEEIIEAIRFFRDHYRRSF